MGMNAFRHGRHHHASSPRRMETDGSWLPGPGVGKGTEEPAHRTPSTMLPSGSLFNTIHAGIHTPPSDHSSD